MTAPALSIRRTWPWGLVLVSDAGSRDPLPASLGADAAVSTGTAFAAKIQHEVDGEALVEVTLGILDPAGLHEVFQGPLTLASGRVVVGDAGSEETETLSVDPGRYVAQVLVDDAEFPTRLVIGLRRA